MLSQPAPAGVYCRISQDRGGAGLGVERQEQDCRELAAAHGLTVTKVYTDNDISAYSGKKRPGYLALLEAIEARAIEAVLTWHPDRLHRSPLELEHYITLSERHNVTTHSVTAGRWDLSTPSGRYMARSIGNNARYESEHKSERIRRARQQQAKAGDWHGGPRPYGYEPDGMTVREPEAAVIAATATAVVSGVSLRSLVRDLNQRGVPTTTGKGHWTSQQLRDILIRPRTAGLSIHQGQVVGPGQWPALIDESTWRAVVAILTDPSRVLNRGRSGTVKSLGSGLYRCGVCGGVLRRGTYGGHGRQAYRCAARENQRTTGHVVRAAAALDDYTERVIVGRLSEPGLIASMVSKDDDTDTAALRVEAIALRERQDELARLFAAGTITASQLATGTEALRTRAEVVTRQLAAAGNRSPLEILTGATNLATLWYGTEPDRSDGLPLGHRRAILDALLTVTVLPAPRTRGNTFNPDYIRIDWKTGQ
jgi:site-specific DNA recombinase